MWIRKITPVFLFLLSPSSSWKISEKGNCKWTATFILLRFFHNSLQIFHIAFSPNHWISSYKMLVCFLYNLLFILVLLYFSIIIQSPYIPISPATLPCCPCPWVLFPFWLIPQSTNPHEKVIPLSVLFESFWLHYGVHLRLVLVFFFLI